MWFLGISLSGHRMGQGHGTANVEGKGKPPAEGASQERYLSSTQQLFGKWGLNYHSSAIVLAGHCSTDMPFLGFELHLINIA